MPLFSIWSSDLHRATRDVDLLGLGNITEPYLDEVFSELIALDVDDGLTFDGASLTVGPIRKGQTYGGLRVSLQAKLGTARLNLQFDVGLGDAYQGHETDLPPLLDQPSARLQAYEREIVIAEKVEATVTLGLANSRMKDFYGVPPISRTAILV